MPNLPIEKINDLASAADSMARLIAAADDLLDRGRTSEGLRLRVVIAERKAARSRTALGRGFWRWRARQLAAKAGKLEARGR